MSSYWVRRSSRALLIIAVAVILSTIFYFASPPPDFRHRLSMGTAYAGLLFLATSLALGPWYVVRRRRPPVSFDTRRDIGIAAGILALVHTGVGLTVHLRGRMWMYFFKRLHPLHIQNNAFGAANFVGAAAALLFLLLVAISNDIALRSLGSSRWKTLQRWTYVAFALTLAHGVLFQTVEKRQLAWIIFFALISAFTVVVQAVGYRARRAQTA